MFSSKISFAALAAFISQAVADNVISFGNVGGQTLTFCWYPAAGQPAVHGGTIAPGQVVDYTLPTGWSGMFHTTPTNGGDCAAPTVVGEITFQGAYGYTWFDVSAVNSCCDNSGVHYLYSSSDRANNSGCVTFPCDNVYNNPDDIQTHSTPYTDFVCQLGGGFVP